MYYRIGLDNSCNLMEEWRNIVGFEGLYQVSNYGRVRSLDRFVKGKNGLRIVKGKILKPGKLPYGYLFVNLCKNNKVVNCRVHRLVAVAFIPNPNNLPQINHKDCNPANNSVWNLEWCDARYNLNYGERAIKFSQTRKGKCSGKNHPCARKVKQLSLNGSILATYDTIKEAAESTYVNRAAISMVCSGNRKTAGGYKWSYG